MQSFSRATSTSTELFSTEPIGFAAKWRRRSTSFASGARRRQMKNLKKIVGTVVSTAMDKTAVVEVQRLYVHSKFRKIIKHRKKYFAHDEHDICGVGDKVQIRYIGQLSSKKHWAVIDMIHRHPRLEGEPFPMSALKVPPAARAAGDDARA